MLTYQDVEVLYDCRRGPKAAYTKMCMPTQSYRICKAMAVNK